MAIWNPIIWKTQNFSELPDGDQLQISDGSAAAPALVSRLAADVGIYYTISSVRVSVSGSLVANFSSTGLAITGAISATTSVSATTFIDAGTVYSIGGNTVIDANRLILLRNYTVATLPASPATGATAFVTDSNQTIIAGLGTTATGGGANKVPVYYDGTNWIIG